MDDWQPSEIEKDLLGRTFSYDFDFLYDLGCSIYLYIFARNPRIKQLFPQLKDFNEKTEDINCYKAFRGQALRFSQVNDNTDYGPTIRRTLDFIKSVLKSF